MMFLWKFANVTTDTDQLSSSPLTRTDKPFSDYRVISDNLRHELRHLLSDEMLDDPLEKEEDRLAQESRHLVRVDGM